jgi:hypothetical protein
MKTTIIKTEGIYLEAIIELKGQQLTIIDEVSQPFKPVKRAQNQMLTS